MSQDKDQLAASIRINGPMVEKFTKGFGDAQDSGEINQVEKFWFITKKYHNEFMKNYSRKLDKLIITSELCKNRFDYDPGCDHSVISGRLEFDPRSIDQYEIWIEKVDAEIKKQLKHEAL